MKKLITLSIILLTATAMNAQWWGKGIKGDGNITTITRDVGDYDQINVGGFFDVELVSGTEGKITIEADSNLLEYIITEVDGNSLKIKTENNKNLKPSSRRGVRITVPFKDLDEVTLSGSGSITSRAIIQANDFKTSVSGSGDVVLEVEASDTEAKVTGSGDLTLTGSTRDFKVTVTGSGDIHAGRFQADDVDAKVTGSGDISMVCNKKLIARVTGSGDIEYSGNPSKQDTKVSGSGTISN
ncbi:DUF2807 domain-containing protein [Dokdonia sinensis]|uniref:DUF2807 domain-containing protein n=1 Tax=Dokdonia sinensis TaxID=2479847 RepID=A0A3M0GH96_9FLAO|nr:head GIN domain-containing protein [Dokdonia sinensis]RMB64034.1 DUF2807 domain-containing protein [Dokdonia sinensis]